MSSTPTTLSITPVPLDSLWQVTTAGVLQDAIVYLYEQGTDVLLYTLSSSSGIVPLASLDLGGRVVYCKAKEGVSAISNRFPPASGLTVAELYPIDNTVVSYTQTAKNFVLSMKDPELTTTRHDSQNLLQTSLSGQPL